MDVPVSVSLGPMGQLFQQLCSAMDSQNIRLKRVKAEIQLLGQGLEGLCTELKHASAAEEDTSFTARCWMRQVRELCYDTADYLGEVMHSGTVARTRRPHTKLKLFLVRSPRISSCSHKAVHSMKALRRLKFPERKMPKRGSQIAKDLSALMARVEHAREMRQRFELQGPTNKQLVRMLAFDDDRQKQLKLVSIFGSAGVGKTKVGRTIYHQYGGKFQCRAFVRVSRDPDLRRLLTSILSQIKAPQPHVFSDVQGLIDSVREQLQGKRYFIMIDDIWTTPVWEVISRAFPDDNCRSRIITTTQIDDVALACCSYHSKHILEMSPLNDDQSGSFEGVCVNPSSERMKEALGLIYSTLPPHLKTCLLYLGMYPEGYTVVKYDLVKQWIAEGFIGAVKGQDIEDTAGGYFDDLVSRGMIQSVDTNIKGEVLSGTVHHMVLDLIRYKSVEENFITIVDYFQTTHGLPDKVCRLSAQFGGAKSAKIPEIIRRSQVRSLLFCGFFKCVPSIANYGLLRVLILHIWADQDKIFDLSRICELFLLRYLKVECNTTVKLAAKVGGLQYLGTLEVDARLSAVPTDIVHLEKLQHLRLPSEATLPDGVARMTSLRSLGCFDLNGNSEDNVKDLGELTNLQDLQLTCSRTVQPPDNLENKLELLGSVLEKLSILQSVTLAPAAGSSGVKDGASSIIISCDGGLSNVSPSPDLLQTLELSRRCCIFSSLPRWIGELGRLSVLKIAVRELMREHIDILSGLPALSALSLHLSITPAERIIFDDEEGFPVLTCFRFTCAAPCLSFVQGAMQNVQKLKLGFNANRMEEYSLEDAGFEHLSGLREISIKFGGAGDDESNRKAAESALKAAVGNNTNTPIFGVQLVDVIFYGEQDNRTAAEEQEQKIEEDVSDAVSAKTARISCGEEDNSTTAEDKEDKTLEKQDEIQEEKKKSTGHSNEPVNMQVNSRLLGINFFLP